MTLPQQRFQCEGCITREKKEAGQVREALREPDQGLRKNSQRHYHRRPEADQGIDFLHPGPKVSLKTEIEAAKR